MIEPMYSCPTPAVGRFIGCCAECDIRVRPLNLRADYGGGAGHFIVIFPGERVDWLNDWTTHRGTPREEVLRRIEMIKAFADTYAPEWRDGAAPEAAA